MPPPPGTEILVLCDCPSLTLPRLKASNPGASHPEALAMLNVMATLVSAAAPRVAVFGGSGFLGSRVCKTLVQSGCSVVSISRAGQPPAWAAKEPWSAQVRWRTGDLLSDTQVPIGNIDLAVSCVGNMRPAPFWEPNTFFGLHWDYDSMVRENGQVTEAIAHTAKTAGAQRFVYVSVFSATKWAYGGALEGYIDGKEAGELACRRVFGDENVCFVGPSLIYGGARFASAGKLLAALCSTPPVRGNTRFFKALKIKAASGYAPNDAIGEVATAPPADVDAVATAVVAGLLQTLPEALRKDNEETLRAENAIRLESGMMGTPLYTSVIIDGSDQINAVAKGEAGAPATLAAAAMGIDGGAAGADDDAMVAVGGIDEGRGAEAAEDGEAPWQSPSAFGAPSEGALMGFKPFLWPWPPAFLLAGFFGGAIFLGGIEGVNA